MEKDNQEEDIHESLGEFLKTVESKPFQNVLTQNWKVNEQAANAVQVVSRAMSHPLPDLAPMFERYQKMVAQIQENLAKTQTVMPKYVRAINSFINHGWTPSGSMRINDFWSFYRDDSNFDSRMISLYSADGHKLLLEDLDSLEADLPEGLKPLAAAISRVISESPENEVLCYSDLFSILDYLFVRSVHGDVGDQWYITRQSEMNKVKRRLRTPEDDKHLEAYFYAELSGTLSLASEYFKSVQFFEDSDKTKFSRHSLDHGRYDYRNLREIDLFKLINICSSFASVSEDLDEMIDYSADADLHQL